MPWFTASPRTFLEAVDSTEPPQRLYDGPIRVPILRVCLILFIIATFHSNFLSRHTRLVALVLLL